MKTEKINRGTISNNQIKAIWALSHKLGFDSDDTHQKVEEVTGKTSIRALTRNQADDVIESLGGTPSFRDKASTPRRTIQYRRQSAGVTTLATQEHLEKMRSLANGRGITAEGLKSLCRRMIKRDVPLSTKDTNKIIEALKAMNKRDLAKKGVAA